MKITIGITSYNREKYLVKLQQSLSMSYSIEFCNTRIFDDCSTEFNTIELKRMFPAAVTIIRRNKNLGPDKNLWQMYVDFLETNDDILVTMDADLICRPDWIYFVKEHFPYTEGIMSLYNSAFHKPIKKTTINNQVFLEKDHIGAAGSILHKDIVKEIVSNVPPSDGYDWAWSAFLRNKSKRIMVSNTSYFQHIGLYGYNCNGFNTFDFGLNFIPANNINKIFLSDFFLEILALRKKP